jgi:hypothetical protein
VIPAGCLWIIHAVPVSEFVGPVVSGIAQAVDVAWDADSG